MLRIVLLLGVVCLLLQNGYTIATSTNSDAETNRDGVPGTGYGCDMECGGADVNYVLKATVAEWYIHGSKRIPGKSGDFVYANGGATYRTRTWEDGGSTSPLCTMDATGKPWSGTKGNVAPVCRPNPDRAWL
ncbi:hypothetical protein SARC_06840 [Sphaeroforma arctica JP610]|uniref:Sushi domain-containing protein n=1 Tax=Sphaeroforma arctica JP610 TaxID=667725 RepID=A0A0L0FW67_9EUKA|nr:hypothetical protein SARC_06840 [Sphaeroforma arctica JP610]KNC80816.1 hypothetical protein SARC_06840 [Sphaeroforma arctica JP610]|eukprot:XP_014154718.1 hypothetical protein SARC_06840 [Sphaeroforma arctica JP610]